MRELISTMMRFSGTVAMFGVEQVQNAMAAPGDTQAALVRLRETLESMADSLAAKMDDPKRAALDSMSRAQTEIFDRTMDAVNLDVAGEFLRKTSESLSGAVGRPAGAAKAAGAD
jgi:hypothetical protein